MAKYELPIYGVDDEILKTYTSNHVSWAVYIKAAEMETSMKDKSALEQMNACGDILKEVFKGLTDEDLMKADADDVMNTFVQVVTSGQKIKGGRKNG